MSDSNDENAAGYVPADFNVAEAVAHAPPTWVYKQDRRSRVWRIDGPRSPLVVKRFEYSPTRQAAGLLLRLHPGQRELRRHRELKSKGIPVVPILTVGTQWSPAGGRFWLVTPCVGESLQRWLHTDDAVHVAHRKRVLHAVADLTADLIERGYTNRDHKAGNLIISPQGEVRLIDVGGVRRSRGREQTLRMLAMLDLTLENEQMPRNERAHITHLIGRRCPFLGPPDTLFDHIGSRHRD